MRKIKFRGKSKEGIWRYGYLHEKANGWYTSSTGINFEIMDLAIGNFLVKESTIGQYTGIKDKNGKEIYEGDIISHNFYTPHCICKFCEDLASFVLEEEVLPFGDIHRLSNVDSINMEVIGNIYENEEI